MRVLVNAASLKMGGGLTYLKGLLAALAEVAPDNRYIVYVTPETRRALVAELTSPALEWHDYPFASTAGASRLFFDQIMVPRLVRQHRADVLYSATGFATLISPRPQALLVHNPIYFNERYTTFYRRRESGRLKRVLRRWWTMRGVDAADLVIFPTAAMREMLVAYLRGTHPRFEVLHYGHDRRTEEPVEPPAIVTQMAAWRRQGWRVLLNVSLYSAHKSLETVLEALPALKERGHRVKLVLTVPPGDGPFNAEFTRFLERVQELDLVDNVVRAGAMPHDQALQLYNAADVFVFPSYTESFGYPMVEAMQAGLPSAAADTDVNREILEDAAVYFPARDVAASADALDRLLGDPGLLERARDAAMRRAPEFRWSTYAERFLGLLESTMSPAASDERAGPIPAPAEQRP